MDPEFPVFKPRYPLRTRLLILIPPVLFFMLMCTVAFTVARFPFLFWLGAFVVGLFTSFIPFFIIREVRFPNEMVVRRHFLPDRFYNYKEFEQINPDSIQAGGQRIRTGQPLNLEELREMSKRWKAAKLLKESRQATPEIESPYLQRGYGMYASFWGLMFGVIVMLMLPSQIQMDPRWVLGGTFLLVYFLYIYVVPRYL